MRRGSVVLVVGVLATLAFGGCTDEVADPVDTDAPPAAAPTAAPTADSGSVRGKVVTEELVEVPGASIAVLTGADVVQEARSDVQGAFTFNGLAPGEYRIQAVAVCCHPAVEAVTVAAGVVADVSLQVRVLSADDLQVPYVVPDAWEGFLSCAAAAGGFAVAVCGAPEVVNPALADPNEDFWTPFNVSRGLRTLAIAMDWDPTGGVTGEDLQLQIENLGCNVDTCSYVYAEPLGPPPLVVRLDNDDITDAQWTWDNISGTRALQYRVFAAGNNVVYQQAFTVHWHAFYWAEAPEGFNPLPDA